MGESQLRRAIEDPATRSGLVLEHGLVEIRTLFDDVWPLPANAVAWNSFARFRLSTAGGLAPTGPAASVGEVGFCPMSGSTQGVSAFHIRDPSGVYG